MTDMKLSTFIIKEVKDNGVFRLNILNEKGRYV